MGRKDKLKREKAQKGSTAAALSHAEGGPSAPSAPEEQPNAHAAQTPSDQLPGWTGREKEGTGYFCQNCMKTEPPGGSAVNTLSASVPAPARTNVPMLDYAHTAGVKFSKCSRCGCMHYCSVECQKAHWPTHKINCRPRVKADEAATDPGARLHLAYDKWRRAMQGDLAELTHALLGPHRMRSHIAVINAVFHTNEEKPYFKIMMAGVEPVSSLHEDTRAYLAQHMARSDQVERDFRNRNGYADRYGYAQIAILDEQGNRSGGIGPYGLHGPEEEMNVDNSRNKKFITSIIDDIDRRSRKPY